MGYIRPPNISNKPQLLYMTIHLPPYSLCDPAESRPLFFKMSDTKPTILITHGAWHHPAYFSSVIDLLKAQGYKVVCPHLPTCNNDDTPTKTLDDDVALIRSTASSLADEEQEIVALMHSYGGVVGTDALYGLSTTERAKSGLKGGLKRLLYMCAFIPQKGQSLAGIFGGRMPPYIVEKVNQGSIFCSKSLPIYTEFDSSKKGYSLELRIPISDFTTIPQIRATGVRNC
jgi:pimeloyl-ACP methyl ester carboxylesterase